MSKILNKKIENLALHWKKNIYKLIFQFSKKKKKLRKTVKIYSIFSEIKTEKIIKNQTSQEITHATSNVTFCIYIQVQNTLLSHKNLELEHYYSFFSSFFLWLSMASTTETYCAFALYEANPTLSLPISNMGIIELCITQRNQI